MINQKFIKLLFQVFTSICIISGPISIQQAIADEALQDITTEPSNFQIQGKKNPRKPKKKAFVDFSNSSENKQKQVSLKIKEKEASFSERIKNRAAILQSRAKLSENLFDKIFKDTILDNNNKIKFEQSKSPTKVSIQNHDTPYANEKYYSWPYRFWSSDYVNDMDRLVTTLVSPDSGAYYMTVDFDSIDLEYGYDYVYLYDQYGLCAYYTGYYSEKLSATCSGNWVQVYVKTDGAKSGYDGYDGFRIRGFYYIVNTFIPVAVGSASSYKTQVRSNIQFDASSSYDYDNNIKSYYWTFGDGTYSYSSRPIHSYKSKGIYNVNLVVTDYDNNSSTDTFWIQVYDAPPRVSLSLPKASVTTPTNDVLLQVKKDSNSGEISNASIDWGDGSSQLVGSIQSYKEFRHRYSEVGEYLITVTVANSTQEMSDKNIFVSIVETPLSPSLSITPESLRIITKSQQYKKYKVSPTYVAKDDGILNSIKVNFGGVTSEQEYRQPNDGYLMRKFNHTYTDPTKAIGSPLAGVYTVTAEAEDNEGAISTVEFNFVTKNQLPDFAKKKYKKYRIECDRSGHCKAAITADFFETSNPNDEDPFLALFNDKDGQVVRYGWEFLSSDKKSVISDCGFSESNSIESECNNFPDLNKNYIARFKIIDNLGGIKNHDFTINKSKFRSK